MGKAFYKYRSKASSESYHSGRDFLEGILELRMSEKHDLKIIQVGANDGVKNDPIHNFVSDNANKVKILFVEPQLDVFERLKQNYQKTDRFIFLNCAVGSGEGLVLWRIKPEFEQMYKGIIASGITSYNQDYVLKKAATQLSRNLGEPEKLIESFVIKAVPLSEIIACHFKCSDIDLLQVDTEGMDDEVIYSLNLNMNRPKIISYESIHLSKDRLESLHKSLIRWNYKIHENGSQDMIAIRHEVN